MIKKDLRDDKINIKKYNKRRTANFFCYAAKHRVLGEKRQGHWRIFMKKIRKTENLETVITLHHDLKDKKIVTNWVTQ